MGEGFCVTQPCILEEVDRSKSQFNIVVEFSAWYYDEIKQLLEVIAVDVSKSMLSYIKTKATPTGATNIEFHHARFLSYEPIDEHLDFIITKSAPYHLSDFWKTVGLTRI